MNGGASASSCSVSTSWHAPSPLIANRGPSDLCVAAREVLPFYKHVAQQRRSSDGL